MKKFTITVYIKDEDYRELCQTDSKSMEDEAKWIEKDMKTDKMEFISVSVEEVTEIEGV